MRIMTGLFLFFVSGALCAGDIARLGDIATLLEKGGKSEFRCAYKAKPASKPCKVSYQAEDVSTKSLVDLYKESAGQKTVKLNVLTIEWPDKSLSRYAFGDSMEITNLDDDTSSYTLLFREWPDIDFRRGLVILNSQNKEHVRVW